jgi:hypothetical protein
VLQRQYVQFAMLGEDNGLITTVSNMDNGFRLNTAVIPMQTREAVFTSQPPQEFLAPTSWPLIERFGVYTDFVDWWYILLGPSCAPDNSGVKLPVPSPADGLPFPAPVNIPIPTINF